jgi:tetraacyldisaccharide 4'-kinase
MKPRRLIQRPLLLPLSVIYRLIVSFRNFLFDRKILDSVSFHLPVISIGNITVGGTGKTPHVEMLAEHLMKDYRIAVLSRGYKRKSRGFVLADRYSRVDDIGDEPLQIKKKFPGIQVAVDNKRVEGVKQLMMLKKNPDVILLDDAFQHRHILPGLSILLVDYTRPVFRDTMLPAGNLREPWKNLKRAHIIIVTKCPENLFLGEMLRVERELNLSPGQEIYFTAYEYGKPKPVFDLKKSRDDLSFKDIRKSRAGVLLVSAIANPLPVKMFLEKNACVSDSLIYPDHHSFSNHDLAVISKHFRALPGNENYILVTEKDAVKLQELKMDLQLKRRMYYIPVEVRFIGKNGKLFFRHVDRYIRKTIR